MKNYREILNAHEILKKYDLTDLTSSEEHHNKIETKWKSHKGKPWYGYALHGGPNVWGDVVDEFLTGVKLLDPNFEIHQIKIKFGGLRLYLGFSEELDNDVIRHINIEITELENKLEDNSLIY